MAEKKGPLAELGEVLGELDTLLKHPEVGAALADRGINISLALVGVEGLRAYIEGDKVRAAEEWSTAAEEVTSRMEASRGFSRDRPS
jgi:hypothetical protein